MATTSELQQIINDPSHAISIAAGPAFADLIPQPPGSGLIVGNRVGKTPHRFVLKKAHMSREDFRIFDAVSGHIVAVLFHWGKNPYGQLDPLGLGNYVEYHNDWMGEWESLATVGGYNGMPTIKIRPKALSRHGRQFVMSWDKQTLFNIGKESKLKNMSLRSNLAVRRGDTKEVVYRILVDLLGRTFQVVNAKGELVCFVQKSAKALILEATLGAGSEMVIDVAPGVDWTAMLAIVMATKQVGAHFVKDAAMNYVIDPLKDAAVQSFTSGTGLQTAANALGGNIDSGLQFANKARHLYHLFTDA